MEPYQAAIEASSGHQLTVVPNKSSLGLLALFDKRADFAMISGPLETEIDGLKQANPGLPYDQLRSFEISNTRMAFAVNLILGLNRLALAEGLVFATHLGLDPAAFLDVARSSAAASQVMDTKGSKMVRRDFTPEGRVRQTLKDTHLMLDPVSYTHLDVYKRQARNC